MKTRVKAFLAALLALMLLNGWSALAENNEGKSYPDRFPESRAFDSRWRADNKVLEAVGESDGFRITITEKVSPREEVRWQYSAVYDPENRQVMVLDEFDIHPEKESERKIVDWDRTYGLTKYYLF